MSEKWYEYEDKRLCVLKNETRAMLVYWESPEVTYSTCDPRLKEDGGFCKHSLDEFYKFVLDNGQVDSYHRSKTIGVHLADKAIEAFLENGKRPEYWALHEMIFWERD